MIKEIIYFFISLAFMAVLVPNLSTVLSQFSYADAGVTFVFNLAPYLLAVIAIGGGLMLMMRSYQQGTL